jgi:hypothetical protein
VLYDVADVVLGEGRAARVPQYVVFQEFGGDPSHRLYAIAPDVFDPVEALFQLKPAPFLGLDGDRFARRLG